MAQSQDDGDGIFKNTDEMHGPINPNPNKLKSSKIYGKGMAG